MFMETHFINYTQCIKMENQCNLLLYPLLDTLGKEQHYLSV